MIVFVDQRHKAEILAWALSMKWNTDILGSLSLLELSQAVGTEASSNLIISNEFAGFAKTAVTSGSVS